MLDTLKEQIKDELLKVQEEIEDRPDRDELVEQAWGNGNSDDAFSDGEDFGELHGRREALELVLNMFP